MSGLEDSKAASYQTWVKIQIYTVSCKFVNLYDRLYNVYVVITFKADAVQLLYSTVDTHATQYCDYCPWVGT